MVVYHNSSEEFKYHKEQLYSRQNHIQESPYIYEVTVIILKINEHVMGNHP